MTTQNNAKLMVSLEKTLEELEPAAKAGDDAAGVEWAMGKALYDFLADGYKITDIEWFKGTPCYTGTKYTELKKAA